MCLARDLIYPPTVGKFSDGASELYFIVFGLTTHHYYNRPVPAPPRGLQAPSFRSDPGQIRGDFWSLGEVRKPNSGP